MRPESDCSRAKTGYAVGGGVEYALSNFSLFNSSAVTIKAEALYYDLGRHSVQVVGVLPATVGTSYTSRYDTNGVVARAGINFKFNAF